MNIKWEDSVWFIDLDDTLIDTAKGSPPAAEGVYEYLSNHIHEDQARKIADRFVEFFRASLKSHTTKVQPTKDDQSEWVATYRDLQNKSSRLQTTIIRDTGHAKTWSREVWVKIAADELKIDLAPDIVMQAADAYWNNLAEEVELLDGAEELVDDIIRHHRPAYIATASDGRLLMQEDGQFVYDPKHSEKMKRPRVEMMKQRGLRFTSFSIGDPHDKPYVDFFEKIADVARKDLGSIDYKNCIMVGDSYASDLETPHKQLGFGLVALIDPVVEGIEIRDENHIAAGSLNNLRTWFDSRQQ